MQENIDRENKSVFLKEQSKKFFNNIPLFLIINEVRKRFPEIEYSLGKDTYGNFVVFKATPEIRNKYKLNEENRIYRFDNKHLILNNGFINPFKYDKLDAFIENLEREIVVTHKRKQIEKIKMVLNKCESFYEIAMIDIANLTGENECDLSFELNNILRLYHLHDDLEKLEKINDEIKLDNIHRLPLKKLPLKIQFKILRTAFPGIKVEVIKYLIGIERPDYINQLSDFYVPKYKVDFYKKIKINPFDVLLDTRDTVCVGEFEENPRRYLVLYDQRIFAYTLDPISIIPYNDYINRKKEIIKEYQDILLEINKETKIGIESILKRVNSSKKENVFVFRDKEKVIEEIKQEIKENPLNFVIEKIKRFIDLNYKNSFFSIEMRKKLSDNSYIIDFNERGFTSKISIDKDTYEISNLYKNRTKNEKIYIDNPNLKITKICVLKIKEELDKILKNC